MTWALYFLFAFGLAYIAGHSTITLPFRRWLGGTPAKHVPAKKDTPGAIALDGELVVFAGAKPGALGRFGDFVCTLIECPACFGFWIGAASSFAISSPLPMPWLIWAWVFGCVTSGANFGLSRLTRLI